MSKRAQLHGLVRNLRQYLEWQAVPLAGSLPATDDEKQEFARKHREREQAKLNASLGRSPEPSKREAPTREAAPPREQPKREVPAKPEPEAKSEPANALWKSGFGAKPRKTFEGAEKPKGGGGAPPTTRGQSPAPQSAAEKPKGGDVATRGQRPAPQSPDKPSASSSAAGSKGAGSQSLKQVRAELGDCTRCGLCETRTNIVFGVGDPNAKIMFIGEAPGFNEDKKGEPFVGKAGALLDKMIGAMTLSRQEVYIANVIKCRPPDNRDPSPDEVRTCSPFLEKQVAAIQPDVIVALGKFASNMLTGNDGSLGSIRGRWHEYEGVPVMPTYHPAYLLRSPNQKGKAWDDLKKVMVKAGIEIPDQYR